MALLFPRKEREGANIRQACFLCSHPTLQPSHSFSEESRNVPRDRSYYSKFVLNSQHFRKSENQLKMTTSCITQS